jgi:hypothetical protein
MVRGAKDAGRGPLYSVGMRRTGPGRAMLAAWCACGALGATSANAAPSVPRWHAADGSPATVRSYWTQARMRAARPADLLAPTPLRRPAAPAVASAAAATLHQRVRKTSSYPNRTEGKVFFTLPGGPPDGGDYECSGTAVRSPSHSLAWTAGHCVFDPGVLGAGYATNWEFVPGYSGGRKPFGEWPASTLATTAQWRGTGILSGGDSAFDLGAATIAARAGRLLQDRIGARRIAFGASRNHVYDAFGYPAERPPQEFDGGHLFRCRSWYRGSDRKVGPPSPMRISCDMTAGASGGAWVLRRHDRGYVASVTSYGYSDEPNTLYGPYQGEAARRLWRAAGG